MSTETKKEKKLRNYKIKKALLISGIALLAVQLVATVVFMVILSKVRIVPKDYVIMIDVLLVLILTVVTITQRWALPGIITKVISLLLSVVLIVGSVYLNATYGAFKKATDINYTTTSLNVYVRADSKYEKLEDVKSEEFGIMKSLDRENTDEVVNKIQTEIDTTIKTKEYDDVQSLVKALYDKEVNVIILGASHLGILDSLDEFKNFKTFTKVIASYEMKKDIKNNDKKDDDYLNSDDVVTLYLSGIDVDGPPTENRNSDVNIIMTLNTRTGQILLLNTPRDYYVPTSVSNGEPDKLTHAGCYGIDCSVETLEMLYGINIDYYIKLNFTGFKSIIDSLHGVDVYSEFEFTSKNVKGYHFVQGYNHMDGEAALVFSRERYSFPTGDNQRGKNQMAVVNAVVKKLASSELLKNYTEVLDSISSSMVTDMSMDEIARLVDIQLKKNISWDIVQFAVTGSNGNLPCYSLKSPNYVMIPDDAVVEQAKTYLKKIHDNERVVIE